MKISERIEGTIENWIDLWRDRLRGWMASWVMKGVEAFLEDIEPDSIEQTQTMVDRIKANPATPPEVKAILDKFQAGGFSPLIIIGIIMVIPMIIQAVTTIWRPGTKQQEYAEERVAQTFRFDPLAIITAWRRDPAVWQHLFDDLKDQGWSEERIEALKFFTEFMPNADEQTLWLAREAYEPDMIAKYGLDSELPVYEETDFAKIGVNPEQMRNKWRAHWLHASWMQMVEMLHRGLVTEEDVYEWFRVVEIVPYWRDLLIQTAYTWPTRVDVRRWWDLRTIDEARLKELYSGMGYRGKNLDDYILWTKVYVAFPDLMARWTNGWITESDVRSELVALGMPVERVDEMIETKKKSVEAGQVDEGRALTKTEIYKGVKKGDLTRDQGIDLLMDLNYNLSQAEYLLDINVGALEGSPETYEEFKDITTKYKIAIGKAERPMPEELIKAGAEVVKLTGEVEALQKAIKEEERGLIPGVAKPKKATKKRDELRVALHRAEAELARVKTEYDAKVAEWKHGLP